MGPPAPYASVLGCARDTPPTHILCLLGFRPEALGRGVRGGPERNVQTGPHTCRRGLGRGGGDRAQAACSAWGPEEQE